MLRKSVEIFFRQSTGGSVAIELQIFRSNPAEQKDSVKGGFRITSNS
jgi:hypothetical protein